VESEAKPSVLLVYYSYTHQTVRVLDAMADVLRDRGCDVTMAGIEFTDRRYAERFATFPMSHPVLQVLGMIPAALRRRPAEIRVPDAVTERAYDLVVIGSPTWWLSTNVPIRSFLESDAAGDLLGGTPFAAAVVCRQYWRHNLKTVRRLGTRLGGDFVDGVHFRYAGGRVLSLLSLLSYLGSGVYRDRYLGVRIPRTNIRDEQLETARAFADDLADQVPGVAGLRLLPSPQHSQTDGRREMSTGRPR
jgi:menaquinone-dependent protoporphyrinogen IX oxidase